ncbi:proline and serine-rich protein 3 isoform X2 [Cololabis saira]|uniref:proline and serine-rich protein 3 isoform X2 n=1 Tax=Cololabis saira TaxID=129043 RepID=UPI002AD3B37B|nr:proline and serine-rich protein 3 isoform X2 [Cololabis saira]
MKSSGSVITRQDPFPPASTAKKTHHPSSKQSLSKKTLSPVRLKRRSQLQPLSHESQRLLKKPDSSFSAAEGQPDFTEIWPSNYITLSPGSNTTCPEKGTLNQSAKPEVSTVSSGVQDDSVLAKYIDRFRHGQPQSREERRQMASVTLEDQVPYWWISHSSAHSSTSTKTSEEDVHDAAPYSPLDQRQHVRSLSVLSDASQGEYDDTEIFHLQQRANRLLLRGECGPSDESVLVSSEGLGCSDFSSPVTVDEPVRQPLIPSLIKHPDGKVWSDSVNAVSSQKSIIPTLTPPTRPEEDILFQWRLRRKMEQAREWPQAQQRSSLHGSAQSWQIPSLTIPSASGQTNKQQMSIQSPQFLRRDGHPFNPAPRAETTEALRMCPPPPSPSLFPNNVVSSSLLSQPQAISHVPAHMHLLCDVLPCTVQSSHTRGKQSVSQKLEESQTKLVHKKTQVPETSVNTFRDVLYGEPVPSPCHASIGTALGDRPGRQKVRKDKKKKGETKEPEKMTMSTRQERRTTRSSSHESLPNKATLWKEQQQQEENSCTGVHELSASPVHTALGQVVSEVLFPTVDSSPAQKIPVSSVSPSLAVSSPSTSTLPPCNPQNSMEVISKLLQEAADSDEKDFEDDPLLTVLRQQRKWVKDQISEVDSMLNEFLEEQQVT